MKNLLVAVAVIASCLGCTTTFRGDPHLEPAACVAKCDAANLHFVGMVFMGEYSSACICDVTPPKESSSIAPGASVGAAAASVGVYMQMQQQEQQRQQQRRW